MTFTGIINREKIKKIVFMPDSLMVKCFNQNELIRNSIDYIQVVNESDAVTICSGLNLSGTLSLCVMENSGIRSACDIISRLELSHGIHNIYVVSNRGEVGEENWWGVFHNNVTQQIINCTNMKSVFVDDFGEFETALHNAIKTFKTEQVSVIIFLSYSFFEGVI